jgi:hypothetical protein
LNNFFRWNIVLCVRSLSMVGILGNVTKTQTALTSTASYVDSSDSKVTHLSAYADSLSSYNYQYVRNKTEVRINWSSCAGFLIYTFFCCSIQIKCVYASSSAKYSKMIPTLLFFTLSLTLNFSPLIRELSHCHCWQWMLSPYRVSQARTCYVFYYAWPYSSRTLNWK